MSQQEQEEQDRGSLVYRLYLRKPVKSDVVHRIKGPDSWADAIGCDRRWRYLAIHDDINYELQVVSLSELIQSFRTDSSSTITYVQDESNNMTIFKGQCIDYDYFTLQ